MKLPKYSLGRHQRIVLSFIRSIESRYGRIPNDEEMLELVRDPDALMVISLFGPALQRMNLIVNNGILGKHLTPLGHDVCNDISAPTEVPA